MSKGGFWQRFRLRYRISALNENTLSEVWHVRFSWFGMLLAAILMLIITFAIFASIIWFTPIKQYLPGYDENIRQELMSQMERIDSLGQVQHLQNQYLTVVKNVMSGEMESDSVVSLDSVTVLQKEELLNQPSQVLEDFKSQYEEKEKDNLSLFLSHTPTPMVMFFSPFNGEVAEHYNAKEEHYGIGIKSGKGGNVRAVYEGKVLSVEYTIDSHYAMIVQHENNYISIYKNIKRPTKKVADDVKTGETLGLLDEQTMLYFELWYNGEPLDPNDVIAF